MRLRLRQRAFGSWLILAVVCLGAGAAANVAVAWALAILEARATLSKSRQPIAAALAGRFWGQMGPAPLRWVTPVPMGWPDAPTDSGTWSFLGADWTYASAAVEHARPEESAGVFMELWRTEKYTYGLPLRSLVTWQRSEHHDALPNGAVTASSVEVPAAWIKPLCGGTTLPIMPLWPGFALNTIFYAVIAWGLWQVAWALRRRRRRRLGLCIKCGYDLKGLAAGAAAATLCPECGTRAAPTA